MDPLVFVAGRNSHAIAEHFDAGSELEAMLRTKGNQAKVNIGPNIIPAGVECIFVRHVEQLGLEHAVLRAERAVGGDPFTG